MVGAVFSRPDAMAELADRLPPEAFGDRQCRWVYKAMLNLWNKSPRVPADYITVPAEIVTAMGGKSEAAVLEFVTGIATEYYPGYGLDAHTDLILEMARRRTLAEQAAGLVKAAHDGEPDLDAALTTLRQRVEAFRPVTADPLSLAEQMESFRELTLRKWSGEYVEKLATTGIKRFDRMMAGGLRGGQVMYLGARPSMGKTALMLRMASQSRSVFFSLEMPKEDLLNRLASTLAGVSFDIAMDPDLMIDVTTRDTLRSRWLDASYEVQTWPLTIVDDVWDTAGMRRIVERMQQDGAVDAVYVDHVGIINDRIPRASLYERTSEISHRIKRLAMDCRLPVVAATQLNREVENRPGCLPYMSDMRNAGELEEDAHVVALMFRRQYYVDKGMVKEDPDQDWIHPTKGDPSWQKVSINLAKNRNGETGAIDLGWEPRAMRYHEVAA
ncbi:MAG: hypothetical protein IT337_16910 [Thermomicrobiales bacterium]|nr:hypothetical protein [Thermomicrobiales bacterium]